MNIGEKHVIDVEGYTHEGQGVTRISDLVTFIKGGIKGEKLEVEITEVKKNFARGKITEVVSPSPHRVETDNITTGGCNLAHVKYDHQLEIKEEIIKNALRLVPGIEKAENEKIIPSQKPIRYRNKGHFQVQRTDKKKIQFGFYEEGTHNFMLGNESILYSEKINKILKKLSDIINKENILIYFRKTGKGNLRYIMVRESSLNGEVMLVFVTAENKKLSKKFIAKVAEAMPEITSIYQNLNATKGHEILGKKNIHLKGKETITDVIGKFKFELHPATFFQINSVQTKKIYTKALEYLNPSKEDIVVDAYGGIGTIGMFISDKVAKVISIDEYEDAEKEGKLSAEENKIENIEFMTGRVEKVLPGLEMKIDGIILDPPRSGCNKEVLDTIIEKAIPKIVYVSCNPSTLGRDLKILVEEGGYQVEKIQPVDQFSMTSHVETVVLMSRA